LNRFHGNRLPRRENHFCQILATLWAMPNWLRRCGATMPITAYRETFDVVGADFGAVAASILTTAYHMLADGTCYQDLGPDYFARRDPRRVVAKFASRIRSLGYDVVLKEVAA
jgi:hypothetical protein